MSSSKTRDPGSTKYWTFKYYFKTVFLEFIPWDGIIQIESMTVFSFRSSSCVSCRIPSRMAPISGLQHLHLASNASGRRKIGNFYPGCDHSFQVCHIWFISQQKKQSRTKDISGHEQEQRPKENTKKSIQFRFESSHDTATLRELTLKTENTCVQEEAHYNTLQHMTVGVLKGRNEYSRTRQYWMERIGTFKKALKREYLYPWSSSKTFLHNTKRICVSMVD